MFGDMLEVSLCLVFLGRSLRQLLLLLLLPKNLLQALCESCLLFEQHPRFRGLISSKFQVRHCLLVTREVQRGGGMGCGACRQ